MNPRPGRKRDDTRAETPALISGRKHRAKRAAQYNELKVRSLVEIINPFDSLLFHHQKLKAMLPNLQMVRPFLTNFYIVPFSFVYHQVLLSAISDLERGGDERGRVLQALYYGLNLLTSHFIDESYVDLLRSYFLRLPANNHPTSIFHP